MKSIFDIKIKSATKYKIGEPIPLTFEITNTSQQSYQVLIWGTPLEKEVFDFFVVERDGERIRYDGLLVSRGYPRLESYVIIGPGETLSENVDLSTSYAFDKPGKYVVTVNGKIHDAFEISGTHKQSPRTRKHFEGFKLPKVSTTFVVIGNGEPRLTSGQKARKEMADTHSGKSPQLAKNSPIEPNFDGGTTSQQSDVIVAHRNAAYYAAVSRNQLVNTIGNMNALYQTWFGAFDQSRYDTIIQHFNDIANVLDNEQITYHCIPGPKCLSENWDAYTHAGCREIWLCDGFWGRAQVGSDNTKYGCVIQELNHCVSGTLDIEPGVTDPPLLQLAIAEPDEAIKNAPNHMRFVENLSVSDYDKKCTFLFERNPLSKDEIDGLAGLPPRTKHAVIRNAFRIKVEGFTAQDLTLNVPGHIWPVTCEVKGMPVSGMTINCTGNKSEYGDYREEVQPFTFYYEIDFGLTDDAFNFTGPNRIITLNTTFSYNRGSASISASAEIELIKQPNPFILHGDPPWLSVDLRLFVVRAGETKLGQTMGNDASAAPEFIQRAMKNLTADEFDSLPTDESTKLFIYPEDDNDIKVFNFALARVHYIGKKDITDVRVFFRLFQGLTTSTSFDPDTTYQRKNNPKGQPIPVAGIQGNEYVTIPCFASKRVDSTVDSMDRQTDDSNRQEFKALPSGGQVDKFYGCWLDINQPYKPDGVTPNVVLPISTPTEKKDVYGPFTDPSNPPLTIQEAILRNPHQCLIAEIAFDPVVIPAGKDPSNYDKLAQRNIAWSDIGSAQALTTFEIRPTPTGLLPDQKPDELMIEWGNLPKGSLAKIYLPAVNVSDVLAMSDKMYVSHRLERVDDHTLQCSTSGNTYIPIPSSGGSNYAGLLSLDLPPTVRKGDVFDVLVRQVTNAYGEVDPDTQRRKKWRRVLGTFQLTVPVRMREELLVTEERQLSVLRWIAKAIPYYNRWHPIFLRYLEQMVGRVSALGGDPTLILPSPTGEWRRPKPPRGKEERISMTGKVSGLIFDRFGDFEGFLLDTRDGERKFFSREKEVKELSERAWRERLRITVFALRHEPNRPMLIIIREPPVSFYG